MNKVLMVMLLLGMPVLASAQTLSFCEKGSACWTDGSGGKAETELVLKSEGQTLTVTVAPGITHYSLMELFKESTSTWICMQNRHKYPDGTFSDWHISATEGVCSQMAAVLPDATPPVEPPLISAFTKITTTATTLTFSYTTTDCPKGIKRNRAKGTGKTKTLTMTCLR